MSAQPEAPAEARLIQQAREQALPPLSRRQAAASAGISVSQWSDIERGSKKAGLGTVVPIRATAQTLARMARTVGLTADSLTAAGRADAAAVLQNLDQEQDLQIRLSSVPGLGAIMTQQVTAADATELLPIIASALDAIDASGLAPPARRELTRHFITNLTHDAQRRHAELLLILRLAAGAAPTMSTKDDEHKKGR